MAKYYLSSVEFIKNRPFDVYVPAFYHPHIPTEVLHPKPKPFEKVNRWRKVAVNRRDPTPFFRPLDTNQLQKASYTIEIMLDMFRKKIEFELVHEEDVVEILEEIDRYLISLRPDVELGNETIIEYVKLVMSWRKEVYKGYYRYMQLNPVALDKLYPNQDRNKNLVSLMVSIGGANSDMQELDPLRAKAKPPYDLKSSTPSSNIDIESSMSIESSFGLSTEGIIKDDGKEFDMDDFLNTASRK